MTMARRDVGCVWAFVFVRKFMLEYNDTIGQDDTSWYENQRRLAFLRVLIHSRPTHGSIGMCLTMSAWGQCGYDRFGTRSLPRRFCCGKRKKSRSRAFPAVGEIVATYDR